MSAAPDETVGTRWPELALAGFLMALGALVIADSLRVGIGWADDGPRSGYFPFYIGCLLLGASSWIAARQVWHWRSDTRVFAGRGQVALVGAMLLPMLVYVALMFALGIYVPSAALIAYFMLRHGHYRWLTLPVAVGVPLAFFLVFERWFLVPLPKGPLERWLGF